MARFVTSDQHYFHQNILKFQPKTRLYKDVEEMNEALIKRHNSKVGPNDEVWYLGDFSFGNSERTTYVLSRLNGIKHLVLGNHDQVITKNMHVFEKSASKTSNYGVFETIQSYKELKHTHTDGEQYPFVLFHFPMIEWNKGHHGAMHIHGHCHGNCKYPWPSPRRIMDAGVDCHPNNEPFAFDEIVDLMKKRPVIIHHDKT